MPPPERRAGVLGRPIGHSLSPVLHTAAYAALGLDWHYEAIDCGVEDLTATLVRRADWAGFSCTMPLKRAVLAYADEAGDGARAAGAANTLLPVAVGWRAENTDIDGILAALGEAGAAPRTVTVLGAGGTAQALVAALPALRVDTCAVLVRDPSRAREVRSVADALGIALDVRALTVDAAAFGADLVVSTLPAGAADPFAGHAWSPDQVVLDVVYSPWPTRLAAAAAERGATVVGGESMLLHQAARQVELMTGLRAPLPAMRAALRDARPGRGV